MCATRNIFEILSDDSGDETKAKKPAPKPTKKEGEQKKEEKIDPTKPERTQKKSDREGQKPKGVPAEPHPNDKKSGTGRGKEIPKRGAGRHNYGTYRDELKPRANKSDNNTEEENATPREEEDNKPAPLTLEEYRRSKNLTATTEEVKQPVAVAKPLDEAKIAELKKEKIELLATRKDKEVDDHKSGKSKKGNKADYNAASNTDYSDLLGLSTNFRPVAFKPKGENDRETHQRKPQQSAPVEENQEEKQPTETVEQTEETAPAEEGSRGRGGNRRGGNRGGRGYRGGRGGKNYERGDRGDDNRGPRGDDNRGPRGDDNRGYSRGNDEGRGGQRSGNRGGQNRGGAHVKQQGLLAIDENEFPTL